MKTRYLLGAVLVLALTAVSGWIHGRESNRWGLGEEVRAAAERLNQLPRDIEGQWLCQEEEQLPEQTVKMLESESYVARTYMHRDTRQTVRVFLLLGPAGPTAVHTPEVCVPSRSYDPMDSKQPRQFGPSGEDELWGSTFKSTGLDGHLLRYYYGWSRGDHWSAPDQPRFTMSNSPYLYKIQVAAALPAGADLDKNDPCRDFLTRFLPVARQYMAPPAER